jgi:hypothetical protein
MKIRPVGAELFHAGGRTDMTKLIVGLRNIANAPRYCHLLLDLSTFVSPLRLYTGSTFGKLQSCLLFTHVQCDNCGTINTTKT